MEIVPFDAQAEFSVEGMESKTLQAGSYVFLDKNGGKVDVRTKME